MVSVPAAARLKQIELQVSSVSTPGFSCTVSRRTQTNSATFTHTTAARTRIRRFDGCPQYDEKKLCNTRSRTGSAMFRTMKTVSCRRNEDRSDAVNDDLLYSFSS